MLKLKCSEKKIQLSLFFCYLKSRLSSSSITKVVVCFLKMCYPKVGACNTIFYVINQLKCRKVYSGQERTIFYGVLLRSFQDMDDNCIAERLLYLPQYLVNKLVFLLEIAPNIPRSCPVNIMNDNSFTNLMKTIFSSQQAVFKFFLQQNE